MRDQQPLSLDEPRRRRSRRRVPLWVWGCLSLLTLGAFVGGAFVVSALKNVRDNDKRGGSASADKPAIAGVVDVHDVSKDYRTNEAAAEAKYGSRRGTFTGDMHKLEKGSSGEWVMSFAIFMDGFNMRKGDVYAYFPASEGEKLAKLEYLSPLSFTGRCDGPGTGTLSPGVAIRDCRLVKVGR